MYVAKRKAAVIPNGIDTFLIANRPQMMMNTSATSRTIYPPSPRLFQRTRIPVGQDSHIYHHRLSFLCQLDSLGHHVGQVFAIRTTWSWHRQPQGHRHGVKIWRRIRDLLSDSFVFPWSVARSCDTFLMNLIIVEAAIIRNDNQTGQTTVRGRP